MGKTPSNFEDLTGQPFGRLIVIRRVENTKDGQARWLCKCSCPEHNQVIATTSSLRRKNTQSCGCLRDERRIESHTKHGFSRKGKKQKIYRIWYAMKGRCHCKTDHAYHNYGGRGITVCKEWRDSFTAFYEDVSKLPHFGEEGYTLDRINNDGNYEPGNVRWTDNKTQGYNRRTNFLVTYNDRTLPLKQLTDELGLNYKKIWKRINVFGWTIEKALETP